MLRRKHWKIHNLYNSNRKRKLQDLIKMEKKLRKIYLACNNLLTAQYLWRAHYQILSIISLHRIKCKHGHDEKTCRIKYNYSECFLENSNFKYYLIEYKCLYCTKNYQHKFYEKLKKQFFNKKRFFNTKTFPNHDNNRFILLLQKKCLSLCIYEWLGKIQWSIITWKRRVLHLNI